jgi:hypothetical protein
MLFDLFVTIFFLNVLIDVLEDIELFLFLLEVVVTQVACEIIIDIAADDQLHQLERVFILNALSLANVPTLLLLDTVVQKFHDAFVLLECLLHLRVSAEMILFLFAYQGQTPIALAQA